MASCAPGTSRSTRRPRRRLASAIASPRIINVQGLIGEQPAPSRSELRVGYLAGEPLAGSADWWVETCAGFVDGRLRHAVFWPVDTAPAQVDLLAGDVVAHFRRSG